MKNSARSGAELGVLCVAVFALALLLSPAEFRAPAASLAEAVHNDTSAITPLSDPTRPSFHSEMTQVNARMHDAMEIAASGDVDRDFIQMMTPHHQGAIDMARVLLKYGSDERLKRVAQSIIVEQGQEIAYMRTLLDAPSVQTITSHPHH
jgi:uncharacterized protein (DUF305 family)